MQVATAHGVPLGLTERSSDCQVLHAQQLYGDALRQALMRRPKAQALLLLEDDMQVSRDTYRRVVG